MAAKGASGQSLTFKNGLMTMCNNDTEAEVFRRKLIGLPESQWKLVQTLQPDMSAVFIYNRDTKMLHGVFTASAEPGLNLEPKAWTGSFANKSRFPAQCRFRTTKAYPSLPESRWQHLFHLSKQRIVTLSAKQVNLLIALFEADQRILAAASAASTAKVNAHASTVTPRQSVQPLHSISTPVLPLRSAAQSSTLTGPVVTGAIWRTAVLSANVAPWAPLVQASGSSDSTSVLPASNTSIVPKMASNAEADDVSSSSSSSVCEDADASFKTVVKRKSHRVSQMHTRKLAQVEHERDALIQKQTNSNCSLLPRRAFQPHQVQSQPSSSTATSSSTTPQREAVGTHTSASTSVVTIVSDEHVIPVQVTPAEMLSSAVDAVHPDVTRGMTAPGSSVDPSFMTTVVDHDFFSATEAIPLTVESLVVASDDFFAELPPAKTANPSPSVKLNVPSAYSVNIPSADSVIASPATSTTTHADPGFFD